MARQNRDVNRKNERRQAPSTFSASDSIQAAFMLACETGHIEKARAAIVLGVDVNMKAEKSRRTALVTAVMKNNRRLFELLCEQPGLDVNMKAEKSRRTALVTAVMK